MNEYEAYLLSFEQEENPLFTEIERFAEENKIPIMEKSGINTFISLLRIQQPTSILEIGSAIGYSAIRMVSALKGASVVTIERDSERYESALEYIQRSGLENRIQLIHADALELNDEEFAHRKFDALFIDAAKGQYKRFFEKYAPFVQHNGIIYCDNMFMHGAVLLSDEEVPKRNRTMIRKLKEFTEWIMHHPDFDASMLPIGDGILIAKKK